jgi:hypothetical protein
LEYVGHIISATEVAADPAKIEVDWKWPQPQNAKHLSGFLELVGFYRKFIKNFGIARRPLTTLLKKTFPTSEITTQQTLSTPSRKLSFKHRYCIQPIAAFGCARIVSLVVHN